MLVLNLLAMQASVLVSSTNSSKYFYLVVYPHESTDGLLFASLRKSTQANLRAISELVSDMSGVVLIYSLVDGTYSGSLSKRLAKAKRRLCTPRGSNR
jgi:hypothetical protein